MFNKEVKELESTLFTLENKLGQELVARKVSIQSANSLSEMIHDAKSKIKTASNNVQHFLAVQDIIQKVKCRIG